MNLASIANFSFLDEVEVMFPGWVGGWSKSDNKAISVQRNLTGTGTELGKRSFNFSECLPVEKDSDRQAGI